ncbi:MAG: hypothetical protein LCI00_33545 [Chloroflexi bacterium]|nr:hypothetical protein [Chloroflexota bacterium]
MLNIRITPREWRSVLLYSLLIVVLTTLPYAIGYARQNSEWAFSGFLFGVEDGNSYIGKMRLGVRGILDFYLFYTPETHAAAPLVFLPYILPGWLVGRFIGDQNPALFPALTITYHGMQIVFNTLLIVVLYRFIAVFIKRPRTRFLALLLATLGGGFGWLITFLGSTPAEFFIPEGFSGLILLGLPHLALARAALLGGFLFLFQSLAPQTPSKIRYAILSTVCWLVVGLAVPFYLPIIYIILAVWGLALWIARRRFPREFVLWGGLAAGLTLPLFAYFAYAFAANPIFAIWSSQNILMSPPPLDYAAAYILLVASALIAARWLIRRMRPSTHLSTQHAVRSALFPLLLWPLVVPILVYLPLNVQRRMAEAVIVPLAILAAVGLRFLARQKGWRRLYRPAIVVMCLSSVVFFLFIILGAFSSARPQFRPTGEIAALNWLNNNAPAESVILTAFDTGKLSPATGIDTGNLIPAYTNLRPYVGHGPETANATEKDALTRRFFSDQLSTEERQALYESVNIRYIFYGLLEKTFTPDSSAPPQWQTDAQRIYAEAGYEIWQIK